MVVRSSRDGLLSISDAYGRVLAVNRSNTIPGATLFATVEVGPPLTTIYTRIGDAFGWLCVLAAAGLVAAAHWRALNPTSGPPAASG
jgi:apolipoprotein N-acyltransferase